MVQRSVEMFLKEVENWKTEQGADIQMIQESLDAVMGICQSVPELHGQMVIVKTTQEELTKRVDKIENDVETMKGNFTSIYKLLLGVCPGTVFTTLLMILEITNRYDAL